MKGPKSKSTDERGDRSPRGIDGDAIDREAREALKTQGLARYEKISDAEIAAQAAEKESSRMAAREAAEAMAAEDKPIEMDDDLLD